MKLLEQAPAVLYGGIGGMGKKGGASQCGYIKIWIFSNIFLCHDLVPLGALLFVVD